MAVVGDGLGAEFEGFAGTVVRPGDPAYEEARRVHNGLVDRHPALIAQCLGVADIVACIAFARDRGMQVSIRGGGHGVAGSAVIDGGLVIDLSRMKGIHVDPGAPTVRAQGGVLWRELNRETQLYGLAVTGGVVSTTGIAGLTLGGGIGWIMGKYGLAVDNLLSADVVTADGNVLTANDRANPELFWGLRGGGGNFGVVASLQYRLHQVGPVVTGGLIVHPFAAAREVLRFYREVTATAPDELTVLAGLLHAPDGSGERVCGLIVCHVGDAAQVDTDIAPLLAFATPVEVDVGPIAYTAMNQILDDEYPRGALNYWKSSFVEELTDDAIETLVDSFSRCPSPMSSVTFEHFHGAATRVPVEATAIPHRTTGYNLIATSVWRDPAATDKNVAWTREMAAAMEPFFAPRQYVNYLDQDDTGTDRVRSAYGPNYARLSQVKAKYDPTNFFRINTNIAPKA